MDSPDCLPILPGIYRVTVTKFRSIFMPASFRRHLVGKPLEMSASLSLKYALSAGQ